MHVAVILPRWVGDAVMATPLLRGLRAHFGSAARITGVLRPVVADLLADRGWLDDCVLYDRHSRLAEQGFSATVRRLRADRVDVAVVLPDSPSAAALAWWAGARRRIGLGGGLHRMLLTESLPAAARSMPMSPPVAFLSLGTLLGLPAQPTQLELGLSEADERRGDETLHRLFPDRDGPLIILNDNSANGIARTWGTEKHAALARWLVDRLPGCRILMHCGPGDRVAAESVVALASHPAIRGLGSVEDLSIGLSKAVYRRATASVSSDSGPRHIAAAFGVPTVALIGPTDPLSGRSDEQRCTEIRLDLPCSPCHKEDCPLRHHDCMRLITVDQVGQAVLALLGQHATARPGLAC